MLIRICRLYRISSDYLLGLSDVDPAYVQRQRLENFTKQELKTINDFEEFLMWRKSGTAKPE